MRKKTRPFIVIAGCCLLLIACKQKQEKPHPWENEFQGKEPAGMIDARIALEMTKAYQADKGKALIEGTGREDALSLWFSLQELKHYIWKIEDTLRRQGCNPDSMGLGMHIYYAKYPDEARMKELGFKPEYALHHTAFLTATYKNGKNNVDFDPWHIGPEKCKPTPLKRLLYGADTVKVRKMMMGGKYGDSGDGGVLNQGTLQPPPPGTGEFPEEGK